jgi:hypothetical protein
MKKLALKYIFLQQLGPSLAAALRRKRRPGAMAGDPGPAFW